MQTPDLLSIREDVKAGKPVSAEHLLMLTEAGLAVLSDSDVFLSAGDPITWKLFKERIHSLSTDAAVIISSSSAVVSEATDEPVPITEPDSVDEPTSRELGTPAAAHTIRETSAEQPQEPEFIDSLPYSFEILRPSMTTLLQGGADEAVMQLVLRAAGEAKDRGVLNVWARDIEAGIIRSAATGRHPNAYVPGMLAFFKNKHILGGLEKYAEPVQNAILRVSAYVGDNHKARFNAGLEEAESTGKLKYYPQVWAEIEARMAEDPNAISSPWRYFMNRVDQLWKDEERDKLRRPVAVDFPTAVTWLREWLPTFDRKKIIEDNIQRDFVPLARRTTPERRAESAYFALRQGITEKQQGALVDAVVAAWSGPEQGANELQALWLNGLEKTYQKDGKRECYSQQQFDINVSSLFLHVLSLDECKAWLNYYKDQFEAHPKIGPLYKQATIKKESH